MKTITKNQRLQLIGLYTLALAHNLSLRVIGESMREIVGETEEFGHVGDLIWLIDPEDASVAIRTLLKKLDVKVK